VELSLAKEKLTNGQIKSNGCEIKIKQQAKKEISKQNSMNLISSFLFDFFCFLFVFHPLVLIYPLEESF
jgi:hypothetical protein